MPYAIFCALSFMKYDDDEENLDPLCSLSYEQKQVIILVRQKVVQVHETLLLCCGGMFFSMK
jgi:hypothetical protein